MPFRSSALGSGRGTRWTAEINPAARTAAALQAIEDTYDRAFAAFTDPHAPSLDAVVWLCVHLAAVQHVVQPELVHFLDGPRVAAWRRGSVRLERTLRTLEQLGSGDALVSRVDVGRVLSSFVDQVRAHADQERDLLGQLAARLSEAEQRRLVAEYEKALTTAPTRPHPHAPHGRTLGGLAFHVNATRDRFMDTLDSRPTPTPHRARKPIKSTRWGDYLLGVLNPDARRDHR